MQSNKPYDPLSWRAIAAGVLVACAAWCATRAMLHMERAVVGSNFGYVANPEGTRSFLRELDKPTFRQAGADAIAKAQGLDTFLYRFADKAHRSVYGKPFGPWNQGAHGSCVSFGWAMGSYIGQSTDWATGNLAKPPLVVATENIYGGSRTAGRLPPVSFAGWSDGSYGAAAARYVSGKCTEQGIGGILYRQKYGDVDLTSYSIPLSKEWGAYGVPASLSKLAHEHTARAVAQVSDWQSLVAAIESGYCVPICSNVGFASGDRDEDGFCSRASQWNHCMVAASVKYAKNSGKNGEPAMKRPRDGVLIINSWGSYLGGQKHPPDQPDGSFWISKADAEAILAQGDSFAIGGVNGFAFRDLHNGNWMKEKK
jgi:hypothetical protein